MAHPVSCELEALYRAGVCFEADGALDLAEQNYRKALNLLKPGDKENFNALHYRLGLIAEALGTSEEAEEHYIQIAANDQW
jgi:tetratricopeptide (TPR) repeat protein